jgi:hypothetical protein
MWCRTTIVAATFAISSSGMAAELAKSGSIEGQVYIHTVQKIDELDAPDGMKAYINELFEFHVPKQRGELLDGMSGRCLAYGKYSDAGAFKESGRCTKVDADGDKIFEEYEAEATGPNDTTPVKVKFDGGTGKYTGIKATVTSTFKPLPALSKTDTMGAAAYKGEYKIGD